MSLRAFNGAANLTTDGGGNFRFRITMPVDHPHFVSGSLYVDSLAINVRLASNSPHVAGVDTWSGADLVEFSGTSDVLSGSLSVNFSCVAADEDVQNAPNYSGLIITSW